MRFHLHIGMNKAASTSIQDLLYSSRSLLASQGYFFEPKGCRFGDRVAVRARRSERGLAVLRKHLLRRCDRQYRKSPDVIISSEHFWVPSVLFGLEAARQSARAARFMFNGFPTRILAVLRRQEDYIESGYHWKLKAVPGFRMSFREYLSRLHPERYDYQRVLAPWEKMFGTENIRVVQFEHINKDPRRFVRLLFQALGMDVADQDLPALPWSNPGLSRKGVEYVLNQPLETVTQDEQDVLRRHLEQAFAKGPGRRDSLLDDDERARLADRYRESNRALADRYGLEPGLWS